MPRAHHFARQRARRIATHLSPRLATRLAAVALLLPLATACQSTATGQMASQKAMTSGATLYMACDGAPALARADGFAPAAGGFAFGTAGTVSAVDGQYVPTGQTAAVPAWAMFNAANGAKGWVSARCLVPAALLESQREANARRAADAHLAAVAGRAGGRGFGEDEAGETVVAGRGAAGAARSRGAANFAAVDAAVAAARAGQSVDRRGFRQAGRLGEFRTP